MNSITSDLEHHKIVLKPSLLNTVRPLVQLTICCHFFFLRSCCRIQLLNEAFFQSSFLLYFIVSIRPLFFLHNMPTLLRSTAQTQSFFLPYLRCFNSALSLSLFRLIISHLTCLVVTALIVTEMLYSAINHSFRCHHHHHDDDDDDDHHHHHHPHPLFICLFIYLFIYLSIYFHLNIVI